MRSTIPFTFGAILLAKVVYSQVTYAPTFLDCVDQYYISPTESDPLLDASDGPSCASTCASTYGTAFAYSYWGTGNDSPTKTCRCSNVVPQAFAVSGSDAVDQVCQSSDDWAVFRPSSTFTYSGCSSIDSQTRTSQLVLLGEDTQAPDTCLDRAATYRFSYYFASYDSNLYRCFGSNSFDPSSLEHSGCSRNSGTSDESGTFQFFSASHTADASASGLSRRRDKIMRARSLKKQKAERFCPNGRSACIIPDTDGYECIDTNVELESCGGCVYGEYGSPKMISAGIDCSTVPGVSLGGATCLNSQCLFSACRRGWGLREGICVRL